MPRCPSQLGAAPELQVVAELAMMPAAQQRAVLARMRPDQLLLLYRAMTAAGLNGLDDPVNDPEAELSGFFGNLLGNLRNALKAAVPTLATAAGTIPVVGPLIQAGMSTAQGAARAFVPASSPPPPQPQSRGIDPTILLIGGALLLILLTSRR